ncbi:MAG TPA: TolC family protein [Candidatus Sulfotelmatobacter sp.]|nr:TolC family protein [Candidatus Sulfotelmatobacter sp.]
MKTKTNPRWMFRAQAQLLVVSLLLSVSLSAEPLPLKRAVELALSHGTAAGVAEADQKRFLAQYLEARNQYIPQLTAGAGLGWSDGFPLSLEGSAPSLFNVSAQSALINPALRDFIHAAGADFKASTLRTKDQRNQIIQDAVLSYAELIKCQRRLERLREAEAAAQKMEAAVAQRVKEGVDSETEDKKARLSLARIRLRFEEASGSADVLREHLAKLTGLPLTSIEPDPDSLPTLPAVKSEEAKREGAMRGDANVDDTKRESDQASRALESNPGVQAAVEHARAEYLRVKAERKALWPSVDFAAQYANLATYNNYQKFYQPGSFQPNNATVGVAIHFPFLNLAQHARVQEAESEAVKAQKQAEAERNQVSEETLRLQRSVARMQAARDVAELESELADKNVEAVQTRMDAGTATLHDLDDARSQASERSIALEDVIFELERSQVGLLRATGDLERWAMGQP